MTFSDPTRIGPALHRSPVRRTLLPPALLPIAIAIALVGAPGPNLLLGLLSIAVLLIGSVLVWRPGESPVLLFSFAYPWLQGSISIFHANWLGVDIAEYASYHGNMHAAVIMSLAGLLALAVGMRLGAGPRLGPASLFALQETILSQPVSRWFRLYVLTWLVSFVALTFAWALPGLTQPLLALATLRWASFFMLALANFSNCQRSALLSVAFIFELATAIGGYFSDFKTVFLVTLFAIVASNTRFSFKSVLGSSLLALATAALGVVWTAIKGEFRHFASGGQTAQVVAVDYLARLAKLADLATNLDGYAVASATDQLLRRIGYLEFFSVVLVYVPASLGHTLGAILWDAILRPFMPRLLFVDKDVIDDTARTNLYTGGLAGSSEGTSISLGYIAEAYIDFGTFGMLAALCAIGIFYGVIYRALTRWRRSSGLLGMAMATAVLMNVGALENSFTKVFGGVIVSLLVVWALTLFVVPRWAPWLVSQKRR